MMLGRASASGSRRGGVKSFVWVYHFEGKPRRMTFGTYPRISLADAGVKLAEAKQLLDRGVDPGSQLVSERAAERSAETVADLVAIYLEFRNGKIWPNQRPGLGVEVDFKRLKMIGEFTEPITDRVTYNRPDGSLTNW